MIDEDAKRRIILRACLLALGIARVQHVELFGEAFKFTIAGMLLSNARRWVICHQKLDDGGACGLYLVRLRRDLESGLHRTDASRGEGTRASIDYTQPANSHRCLILLMAERRDRNAIEASGIKHRRSGRHRDLLPIDRE